MINKVTVIMCDVYTAYYRDVSGSVSCRGLGLKYICIIYYILM